MAKAGLLLAVLAICALNVQVGCNLTALDRKHIVPCAVEAKHGGMLSMQGLPQGVFWLIGALALP
jgi:hypothetical protein